MRQTYCVHFGDRPPQLVVVTGKRPNWFLDVLLAAGARGATSLEHPGARLSDCVLKLRRAGFRIETIDEKHSGQFGGIHGRYVMKSKVERLDVVPAGDVPSANMSAGLTDNVQRAQHIGCPGSVPELLVRPEVGQHEVPHD